MSSDEARISRRFSIIGFVTGVLLFVAACAAYLPVTRLGFNQFDDYTYVVNNQHLRDGFTWRGLKWAFTSFDPDNWFPLTRLSHMLDYALFGLRGPWHHAVNILIHALASVILYAFLNRATRRRWPSLFVAAVFALHPMHVESVAWIAERKDVLCAFFWFSALWAWVRYAENSSRTSYFASLALFGAGLMSKPMIVTLPFLLLVLNFWPLRRSMSRKRLILEQVPFMALSAIAALLTVMAQRAANAVSSLDSVPLRDRISNALVTVFIYVGKTFWPVSFSNPYQLDRQPVTLTVFAALGIAAISILILAMRRERPYLAVGWFWFLITLVPVIGIVQVGLQARADRYMYVPMVGLLISFAWGVSDALNCVASPRRWMQSAVTALAGVGCLVLASLTWAQQPYWEDSQTLYRHAIAENDQNYLAWEYLGASTDWNTELPARIDCYSTAVRIRPDLARPRASLGRALLRANRVSEAIAEFKTALRIAPLDTRARCNLGSALLRADRVGEAVSQLELAVGNEPRSAMALNDLAVALSMMPGSLADARQQLERAIAIRPDDSLAYTNLGMVFLQMPGGVDDASRNFIQALSINSADVAAHLGLASALARANSSDSAAIEAHLNSARQLEPDAATRKRLETTLSIDYGERR